MLVAGGVGIVCGLTVVCKLVAGRGPLTGCVLVSPRPLEVV